MFKRIESFVGIFQFAMVGLIAAPIDRFPVLRCLPLTEGNRLGLGFLAFKLLENVARDRGLLGHY